MLPLPDDRRSLSHPSLPRATEVSAAAPSPGPSTARGAPGAIPSWCRERTTRMPPTATRALPGSPPGRVAALRSGTHHRFSGRKPRRQFFPRRARSGGFRQTGARRHRTAHRRTSPGVRVRPGWRQRVSRDLVAEAAEAELFPEAGLPLDRLPPEAALSRWSSIIRSIPLSPRRSAGGVRTLRPGGSAAGLPRTARAADVSRRCSGT